MHKIEFGSAWKGKYLAKMSKNIKTFWFPISISWNSTFLSDNSIVSHRILHEFQHITILKQKKNICTAPVVFYTINGTFKYRMTSCVLTDLLACLSQNALKKFTIVTDSSLSTDSRLVIVTSRHHRVEETGIRNKWHFNLPSPRNSQGKTTHK